MRRLHLVFGAISMLLAIPAAGRTAFAHGGTYRGPAGEVPPDSRDPHDPPPPESGGGTPTDPPDGGGNTPTDPPDGGGRTPTGGGGQTPEGGGGGDVPQPQGPGNGGPRTPSGRMPTKKQASYESWQFWWNHNKDGIVGLRRRMRDGLAKSTDGIGTMTGTEGRTDISERQDVTARTIEDVVVPLLEKYARDSKVNFDIQASGVIGLAKIGRRASIPLIVELARNDSGVQHAVVEETACLSLGIMQDRSPEVRRFLVSRASDPRARTRTRCFSMFALGLLGDPDSAPGSQAETLDALKALVARADEADREIACGALVGIGLLGDRAAIPDLLRWLQEEKAGANRLSDLPLSFVAAALGKIGQPGLSGPASREVVEALRVTLGRKNRLTRFSAAIALGQIAPQADERTQKDCVTWLTDVVKSDGKATADAQSVHFALASLGRIAGAPAVPESARDHAIRTIGNAFRDGRPTTKSFAALALGVAAMDREPRVRAELADQVRTEMGRTSGEVEARGAFAISLGLLKDVGSAPLLLGIVRNESEDPALRGVAALALGLMQERGAKEPVRKMLEENSEEKLRVEAAVALGLLQDPDAVQVLIGILRDSKSSQPIQGSAALALGQIGDSRAVVALADILGNPQCTVLGRALSAVALGQIGERSDVPVLSRLSTDANYRAWFKSMGEVLTIL